MKLQDQSLGVNGCGPTPLLKERSHGRNAAPQRQTFAFSPATSSAAILSLPFPLFCLSVPIPILVPIQLSAQPDFTQAEQHGENSSASLLERTELSTETELRSSEYCL